MYSNCQVLYHLVHLEVHLEVYSSIEMVKNSTFANSLRASTASLNSLDNTSSVIFMGDRTEDRTFDQVSETDIIYN